MTTDCTFEHSATGFKVGWVTLIAGGAVPGTTEEQFADAAQAAEAFCPISYALRGNVEISQTAHLIPAPVPSAEITRAEAVRR